MSAKAMICAGINDLDVLLRMLLGICSSKSQLPSKKQQEAYTDQEYIYFRESKKTTSACYMHLQSPYTLFYPLLMASGYKKLSTCAF